MAAKILVATPLAAFGELIRQSLEEVGRYQVEVTGSAADAIARCHKTLFDLAILDSDLKDAGPIGAFGRAVLELVPRVQLVVIPPDNNPNHPKLGGLKVQAFLNKPFYLPDLIETVEHLLANPPGEAHEGSAPPAVGEQDTHSSSPPAGRPAPLR